MKEHSLALWSGEHIVCFEATEEIIAITINRFNTIRKFALLYKQK